MGETGGGGRGWQGGGGEMGSCPPNKSRPDITALVDWAQNTKLLTLFLFCFQTV